MADLNDNIEELNTLAGGLLISTKAIEAGLGLLKNSFTKSIEFLDKYQKQSFAIGRDLTQAQREVKDSIDNLNASFDRRMRVSLDALSTGLEGNLEGLNELTVQQNILGQEFKTTNKVFSKLSGIGGLQNEALNSLATDINKFSQRYGVKTTDLVNSIESLNKNLGVQNLLGTSENFSRAATELTAKFGPQFQSQISNVLNLFGSTNIQDIGKLAALGVGDIRQRLQQAQTFDQFINEIESAIGTMGKTVDSFTGNSIELGAATQAFSEVAVDAAVLYKKEREGLREERNARVKTELLFQNTFEQIMDPIYTLLAESAPMFETLATEFNKFVQNLKDDKGIKDFLIDIFEVLGKGVNLFSDAAYGLTKFAHEWIPGVTIDYFSSPKAKKSKLSGLIEDLITEEAIRLRTLDAEGYGFGSGEEIKSGADYIKFVRENKSEEIRRKAMAQLGFTELELLEGSENKNPFKLNLIFLEELREKFATGSEAEKEATKELKKIRRNTEPESTSYFMDQSSQVLSRTFAAIMGISSNGESVFEDMRDILGDVRDNTRPSDLPSISEEM